MLPIRRVMRGRRAALAVRPLVLPRRPHVPGPRRQPDRLPPAAGKPALDVRGGRGADLRAEATLRATARCPAPGLRAAARVRRRARAGRMTPAPGGWSRSRTRAGARLPRQRGDGRGRHGRRGLPPGAAGPAGGRPVPTPAWSAPRCAVEARGGLIHVFFPPLYAAEDWLDLAAAIEATAAEMGRKVVLEGYLPPRDERLLNFSVTPDPGVIEVNIHPATTWAGAGEAHRAAVRGSPAGRAGGREVHAGRPPCRHRRRQPRGHGRGEPEGQPLPAPARPAEVAARLLAQPPEPVLPVQRAVHRPDQPASAGRRGAAGQPGRTGDRLRQITRRSEDCRPGSPTGCSATSWRT